MPYLLNAVFLIHIYVSLIFGLEVEKLEYLSLYKFKTSKNLEVCSLKSCLSSFLIRDFGGCRGIWRNQGCRLLEVAGEHEGFHSKVERNV